jgi:hypothetical protein
MRGVAGMAVLLKFEVARVAADVYDHLLERLDDAGAGAPPGRLYHVAYGPPEGLKVADVWESTQQFQQFCETLGPALEELEVVLPEPDVSDVYNIIKPRTVSAGARARLLVKFDPPGMSAGQYNETVKHLDDAGHGAPPGRLYHVCYPGDDAVRMISVWESEPALRAFFRHLVFITADLGINQVPRTDFLVEPIHHAIDGSAPHTA